MRRGLAGVCLAGLFACGGERPERTAAAEQAIVNGTPSGAADDAVVLILTHQASKDVPQGAYYVNCTGTLLAPNVVLTARHCVTATSDGLFSCASDGALASGPGGALLDDLPVGESYVFVGAKLPDTLDPPSFPGRGAKFVHDDAKVTCNADVALIVLQKPIDGALIAPVRLDGPVTKDEALAVVGWGATVTDFVPPQRQRRDGVTAVEVGPSAIQHEGGALAAKEFLASESACRGDSGGPAFDAKTGAVVGVVSRGSSGGSSANGQGCVGTQHTFMQTAPFKDLVLKAFQIAGGEPWLEGKPKPGSGTTSATVGASSGVTSGGGPAPAAADTASSGCAVGPAGSNGWYLLLFAGLLLLARKT